MAVKARKLEIDFLQSLRECTKKSTTSSRQNICYKVITTKRLDTSRCPCSRRVGREVKHCKRLDLLSATPPVGDVEVLVINVCKGPGRARTSSLCRHYRQKRVLRCMRAEANLHRVLQAPLSFGVREALRGRSRSLVLYGLSQRGAALARRLERYCPHQHHQPSRLRARIVPPCTCGRAAACEAFHLVRS